MCSNVKIHSTLWIAFVYLFTQGESSYLNVMIKYSSNCLLRKYFQCQCTSLKSISVMSWQMSVRCLQSSHKSSFKGNLPNQTLCAATQINTSILAWKTTSPMARNYSANIATTTTSHSLRKKLKIIASK